MIKPDHELATWMFAARLSLLEDGYDADSILLSQGLDLKRLSSSSEQIRKELVENVWQAIMDLTSNDAYCLRTLEHVSDPFLNALVTSIKACGTVQNALQLLFKYSQVVHPGLSFGASMDRVLSLKMVPADARAIVSDSDIDVTFGLFVRVCGQILPKNLKPIRICLTRPEPKNLDTYLSFFPCPISFSDTENSIEFPVEFINGEIPGHDPVLAQCLETYLSEHASKASGDATLTSIEAQVLEVLTGQLDKGTPKVSSVSEALGLSVRSLQRKLREAGISFSVLLKQARVSVAKSILDEGSFSSIEQVASATGFTETSNFVRFFKQQTGLTPSEYVTQVTQDS